jgi:hypothetical protein
MYTCSYQHGNLFFKSDYKFETINDNVYWISMFKVKCLVHPSILNETLQIDAIIKTFICIKSNDMFL